jgi:serine/threonine protein kinase
MSVAMTNEFLESLRKSGLLDESVLEKELASYPGSEDPQKMAEYFVQEKTLTNFQARSLLAGRYKGLVIGPYRILDKIGQGGMGIVYLAEHAKLQRRVAIKILPEDKVKDKLALERFYREARAAAALDHPNIVKAHDVCEYNGVHFLVMEYIDGANLQKYVDTKGPLPWKTALNIVIQACRGLQHAHERNMVHRDIKPANILVDKAGQVKILDLGLARSFEQKKDNLTQDLSDGKDVMGSIDYISPEQAIASQKIDIRADIYSLGATLYTLVTGRPPVEGTTAQKLLQHQLKLPAPLHKLNSEIPADVSQAVLKMLAKKPDQRYATPVDVITALTPFVLSNSQQVPQMGGAQLGSVRSPVANEVQLDTLPVANLLTDELQQRPGSRPLPAIPSRTTNILGAPTTKPFKKKKKKPQKNYGNLVWIMAGAAMTIFALAGTVWLFLNLGKNPDLANTNNDAVKSNAINPQSTSMATNPFPRPTFPRPNQTQTPSKPAPATTQPRIDPSTAATPPAPPETPANSFAGRNLIVGEPTPQFGGPDVVDDKMVDSGDYRGKVLMLVFWSFDGSDGRRLLPTLRILHDQMQARPFVILGVNMDSNPTVTLAEFQKQKIPWKNIKMRALQDLRHPDQPIASNITEVRQTRICLIDGNGVLRWMKYGSASMLELRSAIETEMKKLEHR